ncbi:MAG: hypothetical protein AAGI51_13160 [Pseudomonadota bacterium]
MRKRLKAILQTYESGELGQDRAARRIERLLEREIDRLEDQGRFWGAAAGLDDDGDPVLAFRLDAPTIASPLGYLNRGLEFHKAVL